MPGTSRSEVWPSGVDQGTQPGTRLSPWQTPSNPRDYNPSKGLDPYYPLEGFQRVREAPHTIPLLFLYLQTCLKSVL